MACRSPPARAVATCSSRSTARASCASPSWMRAAPRTASWCGCTSGSRTRPAGFRQQVDFSIVPRTCEANPMATMTRAEPQKFWPADSIGRVLAFATASHAAAVSVLVLVSLLAFLPGFFQIPPTDRDETRFAQATKQMVETGDFIDIRFQDEVRYKKPVGIYWLQASAVMAGEALKIPQARTRIWLYRIPSLVGAVGAVLLTYWTALAFLPRRYAFLAGLMLAASALLMAEARLAKTDAALLFTTVAAMGALARAYLGRIAPGGGLKGLALPAIFWTALAAGVLLKGPIIVMIAGLT